MPPSALPQRQQAERSRIEGDAPSETPREARREARREEPLREEPRRDEAPHREERPAPERAASPKPLRDLPPVDSSEKPFSSDLARAILGLDEKPGEGKPPARKRRTRR